MTKNAGVSFMQEERWNSVRDIASKAVTFSLSAAWHATVARVRS